MIPNRLKVWLLPTLATALEAAASRIRAWAADSRPATAALVPDTVADASGPAEPRGDDGPRPGSGPPRHWIELVQRHAPSLLQLPPSRQSGAPHRPVDKQPARSASDDGCPSQLSIVSARPTEDTPPAHRPYRGDSSLVSEDQPFVRPRLDPTHTSTIRPTNYRLQGPLRLEPGPERLDSLWTEAEAGTAASQSSAANVSDGEVLPSFRSDPDPGIRGALQATGQGEGSLLPDDPVQVLSGSETTPERQSGPDESLDQSMGIGAVRFSDERDPPPLSARSQRAAAEVPVDEFEPINVRSGAPTASPFPASNQHSVRFVESGEFAEAVSRTGAREPFLDPSGMRVARSMRVGAVVGQERGIGRASSDLAGSGRDRGAAFNEVTGVPPVREIAESGPGAAAASLAHPWPLLPDATPNLAASSTGDRGLWPDLPGDEAHEPIPWPLNAQASGTGRYPGDPERLQVLELEQRGLRWTA